MEHFFATCPRGLETLLANELTAQGGQNINSVPGGVAFSGSWPICYAANLHSRFATRILWKVAQGKYRREDDIYRLAYDIPWHKLFSVEHTIRVFITAIRCPLKSLDFITLRVKDALCDRFRQEKGERPSVNTAAPDMRIHTFLSTEEATIYLDTSGEALYKRGFKQIAVEAPLKENLAAGILSLSGWQPGETLLDPMCGSGTFLLEAAQIAHRIAPGLGRRFGFELLRSFDKQAWQKIHGTAQSNRQAITFQSLYGSDSANHQVDIARQTLAAAGLDRAVELTCTDILTRTAPTSSGTLIANPPYGVRLSEQETLSELYPLLGNHLKRTFSGWNCYLFTADLELAKLIGLKASRRTPLYNGALECRLFEYRIVAGSMRKTTHTNKDALSEDTEAPSNNRSQPYEEG